MIEFNNISFSYKEQGNGSLRDINLQVKEGECILLCGRSGCGKTTMIRMLNGIIPHFYTGNLTGEVLVQGQNVGKLPMYKIAKFVGSVFQNPRTQFFNIDTNSEIAFGLENLSYDRNKMSHSVEKTVDDLAIRPLLNRSIFELSGGEKQKVAFASVYAMHPDVFLLDEPSSNLDMRSILQLRNTLQKVKQQGKTILIAEHRLFYLMDLVDKIVYLEEGKIAKVYTPDTFRKLPIIQRKSMGLRATSLCQEPISSNFIRTPETKLEIKDVTIYHKKRTILSNCSLQVAAGEIIALTGNNGEGKTTFSRTLCGLHKEYKGTILWKNKPLRQKERLKISYMVMQDVNYQLFSESVQDECVLGMKDPKKDRVDEILKRLDLYHVKNLHPNRLSGGQKQRVAIAVSMIDNKELLIFDEPTSGLDYESMCKVSELLKELASMNKIIFVITHDYELICQACTRLVHICSGKISCDKRVSQENKKVIEELFINQE